MTQTTLLDLLAGLTDAAARQQAAARLAPALGVDEVLLFARDPVLDMLLPVVGMPQTLRPGRSWRSFLALCGQPGRHSGQVELPLAVHRPATAVCAHGAAVVLLGGAANAPDLDTIDRLLPLLAAMFHGEQQADLARAQAAESDRAATGARALAQALESARAEGSRLNVALRAEHERKDEFLAMLAHELRNPLAPIVSSIEVMRHGAARPQQIAQQVDVIERQVVQLSRLVDDLLDVSRVTRGRVELRRVALDLRQVLAQALETTRPAVAARAQAVDEDLPDEPLPVHGDALRLTQVFSNLLHNAAKYSGPHSRIRLHARREQGQAVVEVEDEGIGLTPESLARIFDLFVQVPVPMDRTQGGLGVGLTLVRRLVELHGGTVSASSTGLGRGSRFTVALPLYVHAPAAADDDEPAAASTPASTAATGGGAGEALHVLIVDDNRDAADSLALVLQFKGHEASVAYSGAAALLHATQACPDLVLLDLGLPDMNGYEVARRLLALLPGRTRLVALTGYGTPQDKRKTQDAGFHDHRVKPLSPADFDEVLAGVPPRRSAQAAP